MATVGAGSCSVRGVIGDGRERRNMLAHRAALQEQIRTVRDAYKGARQAYLASWEDYERLRRQFTTRCRAVVAEPGRARLHRAPGSPATGLVGWAAATWLTLEACRDMVDDDTKALISDGMAALDHVVTLARAEGAASDPATWLQLREVEELAGAIYHHLHNAAGGCG